MIIWGVLCLICAAVCVQMVAWNEAAYGAVVFWAAVGSLLIAKGISNQKQKQSQQQTVIINNYITQPPEEKKQDDVQQP